MKYIFIGSEHEANVVGNDSNVYMYYFESSYYNLFYITKNKLVGTTNFVYNSIPHNQGIAYYERVQYTSYNTTQNYSLATLNNNIVRNVPILPYTLFIYSTRILNDSSNYCFEHYRPHFRLTQPYKNCTMGGINGFRFSTSYLAIQDYPNEGLINNIEVYPLQHSNLSTIWYMHVIYSPFILYPNYTLVVPKGTKITLRGYLCGIKNKFVGGGGYQDNSLISLSLNDSIATFNSFDENVTQVLWNGKGWILTKSGFYKVAKFEVRLNGGDIFRIHQGYGLIHRAIIDTPW